ncbi:MAG: rod shape-determining protein MreC [Patescibacteria group bacterium]
MNYPLKSKPRKESRGKIIIISIIFVLLVGSAFLFPNALRTVSYGIAKPIWRVRDVIQSSTGSIKNFFVFKNTLINRTIALEDELTTLKLKEADYDILLKENEELKNQLGRTTTATRVMARVVSTPPRSPYDTLIIDIGSRDGVIKGNKVFLAGNIILGIVTDITPYTSVVSLFSTGNQKQSAVLERTGATYELVGKGGANLQVEVPRDADVLWGDTFVYPDLSPAIIGSVYYIDSTSQSSFKTIFIRIPGNVFENKWVFVEKK